MKTILTITGVLILLLFPNSAQSNEAVRLASGEWPPWLSKDSKHYGIISRIVTEAFASEGVDVKYGFFPWKRSFCLAKTGKWDGTIAWSRKAEREKDLFYSDQIFSDAKVFFHLKENQFDWETFEDIRNLKICTTLGYTYGKAFDQFVKEGKINMAVVPKDRLCFKRVLIGRIDIFPMNLAAGYAVIHKNYPPEKASRFTHHPKPLYAKPYHMLMTKTNPERSLRLLKLFNQGLKKLKSSGKLAEYLKTSEKPPSK